jgi:hypothetical protein
VGERWRDALRGDPLPWLLERDDPAIRHLALTQLLDEPEDAPAVRRTRAAAMRTDPIASILDAMDPEGWWVQPGNRYGPKYRGWFWSISFLEQMGADPRDRRVRRACDHLLARGQAPGGGFGWANVDSGVPHCLTGDLIRSLVAFGRLDDEGVRRAIAWEAGAISGEGHDRWYAGSTSAPGFACGINGGLPCGWGAVKAMRGFAAIPPRRRTASVRRAIDRGVAFLLDHDLSTGAFPTDTKVSRRWTQLGFPQGFVADALQGLEALVELGHGRDPRLEPTVSLVLAKQDAYGRWRNEYPYRGKLWAEVDEPRRPSKWVTLRACRALRGVTGPRR